MTTAAIRANYSRVASTYAGQWAETLATHGRALADRLPLGEIGLAETADAQPPARDGLGERPREGELSARGVSASSGNAVAGATGPGDRRGPWIVEVGCGPGLVLSHLAGLNPEARVVGVDVTEEMLRLAPAGFGRVVGDAQALPFGAGVVDAVVMPFVLFHLPELSVGLSEVRRVLVAGGSFGAVTWAGHDPHPAYDVWVRVIDEYGAPPDPSPQMPSNDITSDPAKLQLALQATGFGDIEITVERFRHQPTAAEFLAHSQVIGAMARRIDQLPPDRRTACLVTAEQELNCLDPDAFIESGTVLYATAKAT
ncbi:class I SAM-dependent methyltransferase [Kribbella sp. NBC_00382]|uniref:class I SAM-dependent methyltransferase n=1 Tax=Kribbella sp. NBC_00382 TaxID=2975967 RepID=UPI002E20BE27